MAPPISAISNLSLSSLEGASRPSATLGLRSQHRPTTPQKSIVEVSPGWKIYVEESGNPKGIPAVFFHGGPGIRFRQEDHQWFDPDKYRIIVFQQRGTWECEPSATNFAIPSKTFESTTIATLGEDIETLRKHLGIEKWLVFGGSWGSLLSVFYGQQYPEACLGLVVRGIFLGTPEENALFLDPKRHAYQCGPLWKPEVIDRLQEYAQSKGLTVDWDNPQSIYTAYRELCVMRDDPIAQRIWTAFEDFVDDPKNLAEYERVMKDDLPTTPHDRCVGIWETAMFATVSQTYNLLDPRRLAKFKGLPIQVVQGEKDNLCHPSIAQKLVDELAKVGAQVQYDLVEGGPHSPYHPGMTDALIRATDHFAETKTFLKL